jgi:hypothetical protein
MRRAEDSELEAREVAARVAALVVQAGATRIDAEETIHRVRVASASAGAGGSATAVRPAKDSPQPYRARAAPSATTAAPDLKPGETPCPLCGTGNDASRRFCRRCGQRLGASEADPALPRRRWWDGVASWWRAHTPRVQLWPEGHPLPSRRAVMATAGAIVAALVFLGPWQPTRSNLREWLFPRPRYIKPDRVTVEPIGLYDGFNAPVTIPAGSTVHFTFDQPVNLFKVGIEAAATVPGAVTPDQVTLSVPGRSRPCTLLFTRNSGFQSYTCKAAKATSADLRVVSPASGQVQINEVEFFERS